MSHLVLIFSKGDDWISRLIGWLTYGHVTHVALVRGQRVIEASGMGYPKGVREVSLWDWLDRHPGAEQRVIKHPDPDAVWAFASARLGKSYDWAWLIRYLLRLSWRPNDYWVCSELIVVCAAEAGSPLLSAGHNTVTPRDLYMISEAV